VTTRRCDWRRQRLGRLRRRQKPSAAIASQRETPTELCSAQNRPSSANITLRVSNTGSVDSASVPSGKTVTGGRYSGQSELPAIPARSTSDVVVRSRSYQIDQLRPETCHCSTADGCQLYRVDGGRHELMPTPNNGTGFTAALFEKPASGFNGKCYVVSAYAGGHGITAEQRLLRSRPQRSNDGNASPLPCPIVAADSCRQYRLRNSSENLNAFTEESCLTNSSTNRSK